MTEKKIVRSMEEFQKEFLPNSVGKECPHCSKPLKEKIPGLWEVKNGRKENE